MAEPRYKEEIIDGVWHAATHCPRCKKPNAPYGIAVPTEHVLLYCWGDTQHQIDDLQTELTEAKQQLDAVLDIHDCERTRFVDEDGAAHPVDICTSCKTAWPCPTVKAMGIKK